MFLIFIFGIWQRNRITLENFQETKAHQASRGKSSTKVSLKIGKKKDLTLTKTQTNTSPKQFIKKCKSAVPDIPKKQ